MCWEDEVLVEQANALLLKLVFEQLQVGVGTNHDHCYAGERVDPMITGVG